MIRSLLLASSILGAALAPAWAPVRAATPSAPIATTDIRTGALIVSLRTDTQTLARLSPASEPGFAFTPMRLEAARSGDGYVHLGDLELRLRSGGGDWRDYSSSHARSPVRALPAGGDVLAAADMTATMGAGLPLAIERRWVRDGDALVLRFTLSNRSHDAVEIGGLGMPMVFDNVFTDRTLEQAHETGSFVDPSISRDAGYLQVTRLNGKGPTLLVLPDGRTPLEAWRPILQKQWAPRDDFFTDLTPRSQTFEGFFDWMVASRGFADREWRHAGEQWNTPTTLLLAAGESRTIGVRFVLSPSIRAIETTLAAEHRPVAVGIPGYVVPTDLDAALFLKASPVSRMEVEPEGALAIGSPTLVNGWMRYPVRGQGWGRARLSITYADGSVQTVSYFVTKPAQQAVGDLGHFLTTQQWFDDPADPFHRAPGVLGYDHDAGRMLTQEHRVWIAGQSDEGGAGSYVAAFMKELDNPVPDEVAKLERMEDHVIVGGTQVASGPLAGGVRKSLFYYDPKDHPGYYDSTLNWKDWTAWPKKESEDLGRSYNYPHVAIAHWVLYHLARDHVGLVTAHDWRWYLDRAALTTVAMMQQAPYYTQFGQMEGDVFVEILRDLRREGMTVQADRIEALMKQRAEHWKSLAYPFGSEMPWDSTGQPEVYAWMRYFGDQKQADSTREVILAYDPTIPSWGYNGNARRFWDFLYAGKVDRVERMIHHYGSALNAVPLFDAYRADPADMHLLRVAYGGLMGGLANIDRDGFASVAFHSFPDMMKFDPYAGDYGMGFFGHAYATATYLVDDPTFGWLGYGGNVTASGQTIHVEPRDSARTRLFVAPAGLWLTLDAGHIDSADYDSGSHRLTLRLASGDAHTPAARLRIEATTPEARAYAPQSGRLERGAYTVPLSAGQTLLSLSPR